MPTVHFPHVDPIATPNTTLSFPVVIDGVQHPAEISAEALQDHFGATSGRNCRLDRGVRRQPRSHRGGWAG